MTWNVFIFTGKDYIQQIKYIIGVLGSPSQAVMDLCNSDIIKSFVNRKFIFSLNNKQKPECNIFRLLHAIFHIIPFISPMSWYQPESR